ALGSKQAVHARAAELTGFHVLRALQHADDAPNAAPGFFTLDANDELAELAADGATLPLVRAITREQRRKATPFVAVIPILDGTRTEPQKPPIGVLVHPRSRLLEQLTAIAMLQSSADERSQNSQPK